MICDVLKGPEHANWSRSSMWRGAVIIKIALLSVLMLSSAGQSLADATFSSPTATTSSTGVYAFIPPVTNPISLAGHVDVQGGYTFADVTGGAASSSSSSTYATISARTKHRYVDAIGGLAADPPSRPPFKGDVKAAASITFRITTPHRLNLTVSPKLDADAGVWYWGDANIGSASAASLVLKVSGSVSETLFSQAVAASEFNPVPYNDGSPVGSGSQYSTTTYVERNLQPGTYTIKLISKSQSDKRFLSINHATAGGGESSGSVQIRLSPN